MEKFSITSFANDGAMARAAAEAWMGEMISSSRPKKPYSVALSGGRSARILFESITQLTKGHNPWSGVHFFWADERCVPPHDAESNFRVAKESLLAPLQIPDNFVHRIRGEKSPEIAASEAGVEMMHTVSQSTPVAPSIATKPRPSIGSQPVLDLIFLGMGEDGHIASLFPGEPEATLGDPAVYRAITNSPKPPPNRVTLGYAAIAAARQVWVLASGAGKTAALRESIAPSGRTPLARLIQSRPQTRIFSDIPI